MINWEVGFRESSVYHSRIFFIARWQVLFLESGYNKCASSTPAAAAYLNSLTCRNSLSIEQKLSVLFYIIPLMWERSPSLIKLHRDESPAAGDDLPRLMVPSSSSYSSSVRLSASWCCAFDLFIFRRQLIAHTACREILKPTEVVV